MNMSTMDMNMMKNYFHFDQKSVLWFKQWKITTWPEILLTLLFLFSLTICLEASRAYQVFLAYSLHIKRPGNTTRVTLTKRRRIIRHLLATVMYVLQLTLAYVIMLAVMTFQASILIVVILGVGVGYFLAQALVSNGMKTLYLKVNSTNVADEMPRDDINLRLLNSENGHVTTG